MPKLYRPHIPLDVRCRVAMRQLGELWPDEALKAHESGLGAFLDRLLKKLSELLGEEKLHLDHNPPLAVRPQFRRGLGRKTYYEPDANDPAHLVYRGKIAHDIKTRVRGDCGQYSDLMLISREKRRRAKKKAKNPRLRKSAKRSGFRSSFNKSKVKRKWPSRPFPSRRNP